MREIQILYSLPLLIHGSNIIFILKNSQEKTNAHALASGWWHDNNSNNASITIYCDNEILSLDKNPEALITHSLSVHKSVTFWLINCCIIRLIKS